MSFLYLNDYFRYSQGEVCCMIGKTDCMVGRKGRRSRILLRAYSEVLIDKEEVRTLSLKL